MTDNEEDIVIEHRRNERLAATMRAQGVTGAQLAERAGIDVKTVERWVSSGRMPYPRHQGLVGTLLGVDPEHLCPSQRADAPPPPDLVTYHHRGAVPPDLWRRLVVGPTTTFSLLVYAGLPFFEHDPDVIATLRRRADEGLQVRLLFGDPDCAAVALRGREEGIDMGARIRNALRLAEPLVEQPGIQVRLHDTTLYTSLYLADDEGLVNHHVYGIPASQSPWIHARRVAGCSTLEKYRSTFDMVWADAQPYPGRT